MTSNVPHLVYSHRTADGSVLYIGCTSRLLKRSSQHRSQSQWWPRVDRVVVESRHDSREAALTREAELIAEHEPPYNKRIDHGRARAYYDSPAWVAKLLAWARDEAVA